MVTFSSLVAAVGLRPRNQPETPRVVAMTVKRTASSGSRLVARVKKERAGVDIEVVMGLVGLWGLWVGLVGWFVWLFEEGLCVVSEWCAAVVIDLKKYLPPSYIPLPSATILNVVTLTNKPTHHQHQPVPFQDRQPKSQPASCQVPTSSFASCPGTQLGAMSTTRLSR